MNPTDPLIRLTGAVKVYGGRRVVSVECMEIRTGERILLHGANGSGKSTLLRLLSGLAPLSSGRRKVSPEMKRLRICYAPQTGGIYEDLTLRENIDVSLHLYGASSKAAPENHWFIEELALTQFLDTRVANLSGGYQKAAMLATLILPGPDGLFLDEPFSGLDAANSAQLRRALQRLCGDLTFLFITSHRPEESGLFTREIAIAEGRVAA